jgi:hypothetical protein
MLFCRPARNFPECGWYRKRAGSDETRFASLYNDRAISYRVHKGFTHAEVACQRVYNVWFVLISAQLV